MQPCSFAQRSTAEVHYPAHCASVKALRPDLTPCSLDEWLLHNHSQEGVLGYLHSVFPHPGMMEEEHRIWREATDRTTPSFFDGMPELLAEFRALGGRIAVVSHSHEDIIRRHYRSHPLLADAVETDLLCEANHFCAADILVCKV
eukprot:SAG31_NODE_2295_length_5989_cov_3.461630_2_plen_145_part_00